mgnify:CR=1 FL=1
MVTVQAVRLFEPDCSPEKRLLLAVLLNAIGHLQRGPGLAAGREAAEWIRGELRGRQPAFSFDVVCEALDLDAGQLGRALLRPFEAPGAASMVMPRRQVRLACVQSVPRRYRPRERAIAVD